MPVLKVGEFLIVKFDVVVDDEVEFFFRKAVVLRKDFVDFNLLPGFIYYFRASAKIGLGVIFGYLLYYTTKILLFKCIREQKLGFTIFELHEDIVIIQ